MNKILNTAQLETVPVPTLMFPGLIKSLHLLITPTSVTLGTLDLDIALPPTTQMNHCGMVRDVAVQAPAVN